MEYEYKSYNEKDTAYLAQNIENNKFKNMVICLNGELGSGKTLFTKAFAQSLSIKENITSPTFTLIKEYFDGELPLYHMDVYRLEECSSDCGIEEYYKKDGICIIEWSEIIKEILPEERLEMNIKIINENKRIITLIAYGEKYENLCESVI